MKMDQNFQKCLNESDITHEQFREMKRSHDPKVGCVFACAMEKNEELADGKFSIDNIIKKMPQDLVHKIGRNQTYEILTTCAKDAESAVDKCEKATKMSSCKHKEIIKVQGATMQLVRYFMNCLALNNLKMEKYRELRNASDPKAGDVLLCTMEKSGEIKDGKIDKERMLDVTSPTLYMKIGRDKFMEIIDACVTEGEKIANKTEMVLSVKNCIWKRNEEADRNEEPKTK